MTAAALARMLSPFGILSGTRRVGPDTFKGYLYAGVDEAFSSYLADFAIQSVTPSQLNNEGHCDALQNVTSIEHVTLSKVSQLNNDGHCDAVTVIQRERSRIPVLRKKRGRPPTGQDPVLTVRLPPALRMAIESWAKRQSDKPSRSEAIRRLIELALSIKP